MSKFFLLIIAVLLILPQDALHARDSKIYGRVFIPVIKKKKRTFRGRVYRNRLASRRRGRLPVSEKKRSAFSDLIVLAYPLSFKPKLKPLKKARMLQKNAEFRPRVLPVTPGTPVAFINLDRFYHNVFSITPGARFDIGRRPTGVAVTEKIYKTGEVKLFCDIHSQMNATILCVNTPYFTRVNKNGVFLFKNLPAGRYRLEAYHPDLGTVSEIITVKDDDDQRIDFNLNR
ncbi:MAG: hypothetical protein D6677_01715 [Calditrichaeota bacterium]|nr:MAG: hypothetical protein D6677_01715 [Calditrichota bacterium]